MHTWPLLSFLWITPLIGAVLLWGVRTRWNKTSLHTVAVLFSLVSLGLTFALWWGFDCHTSGLQYVEHVLLMPTWNVHYSLGLDGISLPFILLTAVMMTLCTLIVPRTVDKSPTAFTILLFVIQGLCLASFVFQNIFLFYIAFESILIPVALMIGIWGGENRTQAALTFFLYTCAGSVFFLLALIFMAQQTDTGFMVAMNLHHLADTTQRWLWIAFFLAFAVKLPLFPFHTWLPLAHVEAPTIGSVILAAILLKMGGYGFIRFPLALLPQASLFFEPFVCGISLITILYGSWVAFGQTDMKKLVAYASVAHMGYVSLGLFTHHPHGLQGALFQMISHGLISGGLFFCIGMLYVRFHRRDLAFYGGLKERMPLFGMFFLGLMLASMALPGTSGFVGEFFVLVATASSWGAGITLLTAVAMVGSAAYGLKCVHHIFFGPLSPSLQHFTPPAQGALSLQRSERYVLWFLVASIVSLGLYPDALLKISRASFDALLEEPIS